MDVSKELDSDGWIKYIVTSPKMKTKLIIQKAENGFSQYEVKLTKGSAPSELCGMYTTPDIGLRAVKKYLDNKKDSVTVQRDKKYARSQKWKADNASKYVSDSKDTVQQGLAN